MRTLLRLLLCLVYIPWISLSPCAAEEVVHAICLKDAIVRAIEKNPRLASSYNLFESSRELHRGAGAQPNPRLVLSASDGTPIEEANQLTQTFEIFGRAQSRQNIAYWGMRFQEAQYRKDFQDLREEVARTYIEALYASHIKDVEEENLKISQECLKIAQRRYDLGDIPLLHVLQFKIEVAQAMSALQEARTEEKKSRLALSRLMDFSLADSIVLSELGDPEEINLPDLNDLQLLALGNSPELQQAEWEYKKILAKESLARSGNDPDLVLSAYRSELLSNESQGVRLSLDIPIFDWGSTRSEIQAARREADAARNLKRDMENTVRLQVEQCCLEAANLKERLSIVDEHILFEQKKTLAMVNRGYQAGINSYLELLEAYHAIKNTGKEYYRILSVYLKALVRLERAAGIELLKKECATHEER